MGTTPKQQWLVTGANSGLGRAISLAALEAGHHVIATARNVAKARNVNPQIEKLGGTWIFVDVTSPDTKDVIASAIKANGGKLDVLVNNAGSYTYGAVEDSRFVK